MPPGSSVCRHEGAHRGARGLALCIMAAGAAEPNQFASKFADRDVAADTNPASEFWRGVPAVYLENDGRGNPVPGYRTEVRSRWTAKNLYFLFICPFEQLNLKPDPKTESETNELWKWDVAEVFLGSDFQNIRRYKEFEVSPQGEWIDLDINLDAPRHEDGWVWNSGFTAAARVDPEKKLWYAFMRIPYASLDARPAAAGIDAADQLLPLRRRAAQSQVSLVATDAAADLSCAGGVRDIATRPLIRKECGSSVAPTSRHPLRAPRATERGLRTADASGAR